MKKFLALILVASMVAVTVRAEPPKYKVEAKTLPSFKIFMSETDNDRKDLPIIEYDGINGYKFYKLEQYAGKNNSVKYRIALDANKKPIQLLTNSKGFYDNLYTTFYRGNNKFFVANDNAEIKQLIVFFPQKGDQFSQSLAYAEFMFFSEKADKNYQNRLGSTNPFKVSSGKICYIDDCFQIEWRSLDSKNSVIRREAINPDNFYMEKSIPGLQSMLPIYYYSNLKYGDGFVTLTQNSIKYSICGNTFDMRYPVETKNDTTFMDFFELLGLLNCKYKGVRIDNEKGTSFVYTGNRLSDDNWKKQINVISLEVQTGTQDYRVNDEKKQFSIAPYIVTKNGWSLMVPLKEVCDALKAKVIYRPLDGTILIARFFEN